MSAGCRMPEIHGATMSSNIILCVDDEVSVLTALRSLLRSSLEDDTAVETATNGRDALEIVSELRGQEHEVGVVIVDFMMPSMRGDELLIRLHEMSPRTIKIMLTGQSNLQGIKRTINEASLYRFLEKPFNNADLMLTARSALQAYTLGRELEKHVEALERINRDLESLVEARSREIMVKNQQLVEKNIELERVSVTDRLTGLSNRLRLDQALDEELSQFGRHSTIFSVVLLDIDHFKVVNDSHGHLVGDRVLIQMAQLLGQRARLSDVAGRWGGEEFLIVCRHTKLAEAKALAEELRQMVAAHDFQPIGNKTCSFGVTSARLGDTPTSIIARVDGALYRAKDNGRNRVEVD
jgi:diguanylate cyclase (GGDEF)-like protein